MMRSYDKDEAERLNAEPWQTQLLDLNPGYTGWGPHEDYMWKEGTGWDKRVIVPTWKDFGPWELDSLNECVNFYFSVDRESKTCETCEGKGRTPLSQKIIDGFYRTESNGGWRDKITQDELDALIKGGRFTVGTKAEEVNASVKNSPLVHDAINAIIATEARCKRLGIEPWCPTCKGDGYLYVADKAHVTLTLWMLHPRKGCSRGVEVSRIEQGELSQVFGWLKSAADRNAERFASVVAIHDRASNGG